MLVFVGDFKPDHQQPRLPFDPDARLVANLECAISNSDEQRSSKAYPIVFKTKALDNLRSYPFALVGIANNHVGDAGPKGFATLVEELGKHEGLLVAGLRETPVQIIETDGLRCAIIASLERCRARLPEIVPVENVQQLIREVAPAVDRVFVLPHWGKEGEYALFPSPGQRKLARKWIKAGAHGVFGHHPHTVHGSEWIDGKPVFYSLGNFIFDHAESSQHPLTGVSLALHWKPGAKPADDTLVARPIYSSHGHVSYLPAELEQRWNVLFSNLSAQTVAARGLSDWLSWLRRIGPVYIPKSDKSWAIRKKANGSLKTWLLWAIWSLLPLTLLMRFGKAFPDANAAAIRDSIEQDIVAKIKAA